MTCNFEFLVYADVHHDSYTNGITLTDTIAVEDQITQYAVDHHISHVLFLGDWYRASNPLRHVIAEAEAAWKRRSDAGIVTLVIVGNHDRATKSVVSDHAFVSAAIFKQDLKNVIVVDKAMVVPLNDQVNIICIPAGHEYGAMELPIPIGFNVVLFHGMLTGSVFARGGSASNKLDPRVLSRFKAQLVLGGDNHTPQDLTN
jgi:hypothetical protein